MYPWSIDARKAIQDVSDIDDALIEETKEIEKFLHQDRYYFVIATKGLGKSLLLLAKRKNLKGVECIPRGTLLDVPVLALDDLSRDMISLICKEDTMSLLWAISIIIAIIKNLKMTDNILEQEISKSLKNLLEQEKYTVSDYFSTILRSIHIRQFYTELKTDYENILIPATRGINTSVAVFIDNVDECFEKSNIREIWYIAQNSLVRAIYKLVTLNPGKIKLFASIRKEAFLKLQTETEMFQQYKGVSLDLSYYKDELKEIFIKNINKEDTENLVDENLIKKNPFVAYLGVEKVLHDYANEEEEIFDYIYRHTLKRPRDFMEIGRIISRCPTSERNPKNQKNIHKIKQLINKAGTEIANEYITEVLPHLTINRQDFDKVFGFIDSNILEKKKLKEICMKFNGDDAECLRMDCKSCKKTHIFCELYKIGLLGHVTEDVPKKGVYVQKFTTVGERIFDEVRLLPDSIHYLIHPILDELIRQKNSLYKDQIDTTNIVGYERPWKMNKEILPKSPVKARNIVEGPFKIDFSTPRLIGENKKTIPLKPPSYLVLKAMHTSVGHMPLGVLKDELIAMIFLKAKGKGDEEIRKSDPKEVSEQFARSLRRHLENFGIIDKDAIIQRAEGGFIPGNLWDEKPVKYGSQVSTSYTESELYRTDDPRVRKKGKRRAQDKDDY